VTRLKTSTRFTMNGTGTVTDPIDELLTEDGDKIITEDGDTLITEDS